VISLNSKRILRICVVLAFVLVSNIAVSTKPAVTATGLELPTAYPLLYVYPERVSEPKVNETFTISVVVFNLTDNIVPNPDWQPGQPFFVPLGNLYGFDIQFTWDPTVLEYVNYTNPEPDIGGYKHLNVTVPVEDYPYPIPPCNYTGILHEPFIEVVNVVNETHPIPGAEPDTKAWFAYGSVYPADPFNGNGTFFTMTFKVLRLAESPLKFTSHILASGSNDPDYQYTGDLIYYMVQDGVFRPIGLPVASFTYWPDIAVIDKPLYFNASVTENVTAIETYMWDFGDGTQLNSTVPEVEHTYNATGVYIVSLKVFDKGGMESGVVTKDVKVVGCRDLTVSRISDLHWGIYRNLTLPFTTTIENTGESDENCTVIAYYNASSVNWENIADTQWIEIGTNTTLLSPGDSESVGFTFNASVMPQVEAYYYILVNATGIPHGYERNTADNVKISDTPIFVTEQIIHGTTVTDLKRGHLVLKALRHPVISGENSTITTAVKNNGTYVDTIDVKLYINGSFKESWNPTLNPGDVSSSLSWSGKLEAGYYNITVEAIAGDAVDVRQDFLLVILTPELVIDYSPETVFVNQTVTLDASGSSHNEPTANITSYTWKIYAPMADGSAIPDPETASPTKTFLGVTETSITCNFTKSGNWTIVLEVTDNYGITYDTRRVATRPYRSQMVLYVNPAAAPGFPIEYIAAIIIVLVIVVALAVFLYRRRTKIPEV